jgi:hypothetical protein
MRIRTHLEHKTNIQNGRDILTASLRAPGRADHAVILADAAANTCAAAPLPSLGVLLWPGGYHIHWIEQDLGARHGRFHIVRHDMPRSWSHLYGADRAMPLLDPHELSLQRGEFAAQVRARRFVHIVTVLNDCRAVVAQRLAAEGRAS